MGPLTCMRPRSSGWRVNPARRRWWWGSTSEQGRPGASPLWHRQPREGAQGGAARASYLRMRVGAAGFLWL